EFGRVFGFLRPDDEAELPENGAEAVVIHANRPSSFISFAVSSCDLRIPLPSCSFHAVPGSSATGFKSLWSHPRRVAPGLLGKMPFEKSSKAAPSNAGEADDDVFLLLSRAVGQRSGTCLRVRNRSPGRTPPPPRLAAVGVRAPEALPQFVLMMLRCLCRRDSPEELPVK
ncbi:hypothetical protein CSUI_003096, partial [Cystoisospora suis]